MSVPLIRCLCLLSLLTSSASAVTMDWVYVGTPNTNAFDNSSNCASNSPNCGQVDYGYYISKYEVTNTQYAEFLNAVDASGSNALALYSTNMATDAAGGIIFLPGNASGSKYVVRGGFANKPVNFVSFYDTLRFTNWLNNGQGTTETGAYTLLGGTPTPSNGATVTRNVGAIVMLPSENEWYKAAYYNPPSNSFFAYPMGSNASPGCVAPGSDSGNSANCFNAVGTLTNVGAYSLSDSPYGTFDQGGNVEEWNEQIVSGSGSGLRNVRGGDSTSSAFAMSASGAGGGSDPTHEFSNFGFRVAMIPNSQPRIIYSNFGPVQNSTHDVVNQDGYLEHAARFVVPSNLDFRFIGVDLAIDDTLFANEGLESELIVKLWSDTDGQPGSILESAVTDVANVTPGYLIQRVDSLFGTTLLTRSHAYWISLAATHPGRVAWFVNNGQIGGSALRNDPQQTDWVVSEDGISWPQGTLRVVPEPGGDLMLRAGVLGLLGLAGWRRVRE